jgi:hypothetical protein
MILAAPTLTGHEVTLRPMAGGDVDALAAAAAESREHFGLSVVPNGIDEMRAFEGWQTHSVWFKTDERNQRSRRAIERLGAGFDGIRRADMPAADGTVRNSAHYSIVAAEWPAIKQRLQQLLSR